MVKTIVGLLLCFLLGFFSAMCDFGWFNGRKFNLKGALFNIIGVMAIVAYCQQF